ncbi:tetratricopeptide repeat protein [Motilimonas cestriensis]|uniref:Tetratricopeptide repeat protein n=1 Tax=Motilimonas cestriensis TaxID=2742685 RepID=A0ABS8WDI3_9GAMM|nr:tetratricopeptide repeat protein [Motilimonas cestriensis]MCE2597104.1 tetratricopeptide repeat protein [Motilimonas cestriensis]
MVEKIEKYKSYLSSDPGNLILALQLVKLISEEGTIDDALSVLAPFKSEVNDDADDSIVRELTSWFACLYLAKRDYQSAIKYYDILTKSKSCEISFLVNGALAHYQLNDFKNALSLLERANSDAPEHHILKSRCLYNEGDIAAATMVIESLLLHCEPQCVAEAEGLFSMLLMDAGEYERANELVIAALAKDKYQTDALISQATLALYELDIVKADAGFTALLQSHPNNGRILAMFALSLLYQKQYARAEQAFLKAVQLMPNHVGTWVNLGWCQFALEKFDHAENSFYKAVEIDRSFAEGHGGLAVVDSHFERWSQATKKAKRAIRLDPQSPSGWYAQSLILANEGEQAKAQAIIDKLLTYQSQVSQLSIAGILLNKAAPGALDG